MLHLSSVSSSSHHPAGGDAIGDGGGAGGGFLVKLVGGDEVHGQRDLDAVLLCFGHQVLDDAGALLVVQGGSDLSGETQCEMNVSASCIISTVCLLERASAAHLPPSLLVCDPSAAGHQEPALFSRHLLPSVWITLPSSQ